MSDKAPITLENLVRASHAAALKSLFWETGITAESLLAKLALVGTEVAEAVEEIRDPNKPLDGTILFNEKKKPIGLAIEIADIIIRCCDLAGALQVNLDEAVRVKMAYNDTRPPKHNKRI